VKPNSFLYEKRKWLGFFIGEVAMKYIVWIVLTAFFLTSLGPLAETRAQTILDLPAPGSLIEQSNAYNPLQLKGIKVYVESPFHFDFLVDKGESKLNGQDLKDEITRLTKYFLTSLTVPETDLWVNLSPYEKNRISPESFGITQMGKDLLEQDYLLKQITASLTYPENGLGKKFWQEVYKKSYELFGTTDIPINSFNKVWIVPKRADVFVRGNSAFVVKSQLDVMLEEDYLAMNKKSGEVPNEYSKAQAQIVRQVILPQLRKEINEGKNFIVVRQVYNAMILATWYKRHLKNNLLGKFYIGKNKVTGVDVADKEIKEKIYHQYLRSYKKAVYNYIKEDYDPISQKIIPRKYMSGGIEFENFGVMGDAVFNENASREGLSLSPSLAMASIRLFPSRVKVNLHTANRIPVYGSASKGISLAVRDAVSSGMIPSGQMFADNAAIALIPTPPKIQPTKPSSQSIDPNWPFDVHTDVTPTLPDEEELALVASGKLESKKQKEEMDFNLSKQSSFEGKNSAKNNWFNSFDLLGLIAGIGIAWQGNPNFDIGWMGAVALFAGTRFIYAAYLVTHELWHTVFAFFQSPKEYKKILTRKNFRAHYDLPDWLRQLMPFMQLPKKRPGVDVPLSIGERRINQVSGFAFSSILSIVAFAVMIKTGFFVPLLGPLAAASVHFLKNSFQTDILNPSSQGDLIECGNSGVIWLADQNDSNQKAKVEGFFPEFSQDVLIKMRYISELRGDQGEGIFTWGQTEEGDVIPIIYKVMKSKRGKTVIEMTQVGFKKEIEENIARGVRPIKKIRIINVHDRFATQGKPTQKALHPHMGPREQRKICFFEEGQLKGQERTLVTVISENGDNNAQTKHKEKLPTKKLREYYPKLYRMKKDVYIEPNHENPKGYYDYLPPGDAPVLALQIQWYDNQGDGVAASRFAYGETMNDSSEEMMGNILSEEDENNVGNFFMNYFWSQQDKLLRLGLKKKDKSFKDLWVTKEMAEQYPQLRFQYDQLEEFRKSFLNNLLAEMAKAPESTVGKVLNSWKQRHSKDFDQRLECFVNMTVERFFTANRSKATQEIAELSDGTYGVTVRNSKEPESVTIWTNGQSVSLGVNAQKGYLAFNSEHRALMTNFEKTDPLKEILFLNSEPPGQLTDVTFNSQSRKVDMRVYDFKEKRLLSPQELQQWRFPLEKENVYFNQNVKRSPSDFTDQDIGDIPKAVAEARKDWKDKNSFNVQTGEDFFRQMASRFVERYIQKNSRFYKVARGNLLDLLYRQADNCQGEKCSDVEKNKRKAELIRAVEYDNRVLSYLQSRLDEVVAFEADNLSKQIIDKERSEDDLYPYLREIDKQLEDFMTKEIVSLSSSLINNNTEFLSQWEQQQEEVQGAQKEIENDWFNEEDKDAGKSSPMVSGKNLPDKQSVGTGEADLFAAGMGNSLWIGAENLKNVLHDFFPEMIVETNSSNKAINIKPGDRHRLGRRTLSYVTSKTGGTSASKNLPQRLKKIMPGRNYICTADPDTLMGLSIGQKYYTGAPFSKRIFVTGKSYHAEVDSLGDVELLVNQIEMVLFLVRRMKDSFPRARPWGFSFSDEQIRSLEQRRDKLVEKAKQLTAKDEQGNSLPETKEHQGLIQTGRIFGNMLKETFMVNQIARGSIFLLSGLMTYLGFHYFKHEWAAYIASLVETTLALSSFYLITSLIYRPLTKRMERWGWMGPLNVSIGDVPVLNQVMEVNAGQRGGMAIGSIKPHYYGANPQDHYAFRRLHEVVPGAVQIFGVPNDPYERENTLMTVSQSNVRYPRLSMLGGLPLVGGLFKKKFVGGPEIFTIGHGEVDPNLTHHHVNIGPVEIHKITADMPHEQQESQERLNQFYSHSFDILDRLIAYNVFFNEAYNKASRIGPWKIFQQGKSFSRVRVFNTPSPVGGAKRELPFYEDDNKEYGKTSPLEMTTTHLGKDTSNRLQQKDLSIHRDSISSKRGGIDMNSRWMDLKETGVDPKVSADKAMLSVPIDGVIPEVFEIVPLTQGRLEAILSGVNLN